MARLALIATLLLSSTILSGCVPVAIGAGGAIAADTIAEDRGRDLFCWAIDICQLQFLVACQGCSQKGGA